MKNLPRILKGVSKLAANEETPVVPLITQPLRDFSKQLNRERQARQLEMQRQIEQREWKYKPGDRVLTPNGQVHEITAYSWAGGKNGGPRYMAERVDVPKDSEGWYKGHMIADILDSNEDYQLMSGPRKDFAAGGLARVAKAMSGPRSKHPGIIKEVGGNWETEFNLPHRTYQIVPYEGGGGTRAEEAVENWINGPLTKYIKSTMGTAKDPVLKRIDQGAPMHISPQARILLPPRETIQAKRIAKGFPEHGISKTPQGMWWEDTVDNAIDVEPLSRRMELFNNIPPWMEKADPNMPIHSLGPIDIMHQLGFDHLADELHNSLRRGTDIPVELRLNPGQLQKMGLEQAIDHVSKINAWRQAQAAEAAKVELAPAIETVMEFPDGYKWVKLRKGPDTGQTYEVSVEPDYEEWKKLRDRAQQTVNEHYGPVETIGRHSWHSLVDEHLEDLLEEYSKTHTRPADTSQEILSKALEAEGRNMKHCVGGYCDKVLRGESEIYSLRDPEGNPHITIEKNPPRAFLRPDIADEGFKHRFDEKYGEGAFERLIYDSEFDKLSPKELDDFSHNIDDDHDVYRWFRINRPELLDPSWGDARPSINQVFGVSNSTPKAEYMPYIQNFLRQGDNPFYGRVHENAGFTPEEVSNLTDVDRWLEHMYDLGTPGYD